MYQEEDLITPQLKRFIKKIPSRGFDNKNWFGYTLPKRIEKLGNTIIYAPPQLIYVTKYDRDTVKQLYQQATHKIITLENHIKTTQTFTPHQQTDMLNNIQQAKYYLQLTGKHLHLTTEHQPTYHI